MVALQWDCPRYLQCLQQKINDAATLVPHDQAATAMSSFKSIMASIAFDGRGSAVQIVVGCIMFADLVEVLAARLMA